ncbi:MAG TPA: glycosyltransferase family 1 protein [Candidatus Moranbacteria bacterium]|nr:glycosyltransferase family 1 protein [Candidatus Moranbacteria bacterium]
MKSLLTKFKKTGRLWRQSGFLEGTKIIFSYLKIYLESFFVGSGDILFISSGVGNSAHYRVYNVAEELRLHKFKTAITNADNPHLIKMASKFDIFIFHRVVYNNAIKNLIQKIKKQKKEIIFDTDDLVYDPNFLVYMDYFKKISAVEKELYKKGIGSEIINNPYVKIATTPVEFLAEKIRQKGKKVFIVPNRLSNKEIALAEKILKGEKKKDNFIRIGYFSGTLSHNKDFAMIVPALIKIIERYPQVKLCLAGPLEIDKSLNKFKKKIEGIPFVSRDKYFNNLSQVDINLAPL